MSGGTPVGAPGDGAPREGASGAAMSGGGASGMADLLHRVHRNAEVFETIENLVERRLAQGRYASAMAWTRVAGSFATTNPSPTFRSLRLDRALDEISRRVLPPAPGGSRAGGAADVRSVLHLLSEAHNIGGDVRFASRWATLDRQRTSSFVITRPGLDHPSVYELAAECGGTCTVLSGSLLERAAQLRQLAAGFDLIVCHSQNEDTVPGVAFGGDYVGPPVVLVNHGDHVCNLGNGNISALVTPRRSGVDFAVAARSYPERVQYLLPIPISDARRSTREEAKARLGIPAEQVVALTVARAKKYLPSPLQPALIDVIEPVLASRDVLMLAVGPSQDESPWAEASSRLGDRLRCAGPQPDPSTYFDAADVYIDSFPFCSNTSSLEAAVRGTPVASYRPYHGFQQLHSSEGTLDDVVVTAHTLDEYRAQLARLFDDQQARQKLGPATAEAVDRVHGPAAWLATLEGLYEHATTTQPLTERTEVPVADPRQMLEYAATLAGIEDAAPLLHSVMLATEAFDGPDRAAALVATTTVRAWAKARGGISGPDGAALLIPRL